MNCVALTSITGMEGVVTIGNNAFARTYNTTSTYESYDESDVWDSYEGYVDREYYKHYVYYGAKTTYRQYPFLFFRIKNIMVS